MNNKKLSNVKKLKILFLKKNIELRINQMELNTYGLSILAKPKTILFSKNANT